MSIITHRAHYEIHELHLHDRCVNLAYHVTKPARPSVSFPSPNKNNTYRYPNPNAFPSFQMFVQSNTLVKPTILTQIRAFSNFANFKLDKSYEHKPIWKKEHLNFQDLVTLTKHRGFIFPGSEHYGGLKGTFDYGPLGIALKRNIMKAWHDTFVQTAPDVVALDSAITLHPKVWKVAGHVDNFTDPLVECKGCHVRYRVDKMLEDKGMIIENH